MSSGSWDPKQYDKFKNERSQPFFDLMNLLQPCKNANVIDLGCGTGELTAQLHQHVKAKSTLGIDNSAEMLIKANAYATADINFQTGNIETWNAKNSFDIVFSNAALQWCKNHPRLLTNIKESLKPGGQIAIQMPMNHDYPTHIIAREMGNEKDVNMLLAEDYAKILFDLGFKEQKVFVRVYSHILDSRQEVIEWVKGTLLTPIKGSLSASEYEKFLTEYRQRLFQVLPDEKPFFYPFKRVLMWARL